MSRGNTCRKMARSITLPTAMPRPTIIIVSVSVLTSDPNASALQDTIIGEKWVECHHPNLSMTSTKTRTATMARASTGIEASSQFAEVRLRRVRNRTLV